MSSLPATSPAGGRVPARPAELLAFARTALDLVREREPLTQCLTNSVVTNFTANALLALGAAPAMVDIPVEADAFARVASGVLVNLGTPHAEQRAAMTEAARAAGEAGTPWVLDPVAIGALAVRTALAHELLALRPAVVRGNASEILALAGAGGGGRGVDSAQGVEAAADAARALARSSGAVVAVSGAVDLVTDGERECRIANGDVLLTRVTGGGCALGAVMAAYASVDLDRFATTVAAVTAYTVAAEQAATPLRTGGDADGGAGGRPGPGTFAVRFLDALAALDGAGLAARAALS